MFTKPTKSCFVFDMQQRKQKQIKFRKTENWNKIIIYICLCHFACRWAHSNMFNICLHLKTTAAVIFFTCLLWTITSSPETIMSHDVIWRHVCINNVNTDDSKVTWSVTWVDVLFAANLVIFPSWLADEWTKFSIHCERFSLKKSALLHIRCQVTRNFTSTN